jgi:hypothetical protein
LPQASHLKRRLAGWMKRMPFSKKTIGENQPAVLHVRLGLGQLGDSFAFGVNVLASMA